MAVGMVRMMSIVVVMMMAVIVAMIRNPIHLPAFGEAKGLGAPSVQMPDGCQEHGERHGNRQRETKNPMKRPLCHVVRLLLS